MTASHAVTTARAAHAREYSATTRAASALAPTGAMRSAMPSYACISQAGARRRAAADGDIAADAERAMHEGRAEPMSEEAAAPVLKSAVLATTPNIVEAAA